MKFAKPSQKQIFDFLDSRKALVVCVIIAGFLTLLFHNTGVTNGEVAKEAVKADPSVDTYIPVGFVLVPIEVQNYESLDSILGSHGVVDLFLPSPTGKGKGSRVAHKVKIMRAPLNPSQFAVLVRDNESEELVRTESAFFVVVQNSKQSGTGIVNGDPQPAKKRVSRVVMEAE